MNKEAYARGFCKVAQAHGVDPVALAKYAATNNTVVASQPLYKTDGWAPAPVRAFKKTIPNYNPIAATHDVIVGNSALSALSPTRIQQALTKLVSKYPPPSEEYSDLSDARSAVDPRYKNWRNAHIKVDSNPSISDLQELAKIDLRKLPISAYTMTGKDYMENMKHVAPEFANLWFNFMRNKSSDGQGNGFLKRPILGEFQKAKKLVGEITPERMIARTDATIEDKAAVNSLAANYANITNILDKIQQQTGKPLWDVKNVKVPTNK